MRLPEEFISSQSDAPFRAMQDKKGNANHCNNTGDDVLLRYELVPLLWLRLIQASFHDGPADRVQSGLDIDYPSQPAMQEVEVVVWDASDQGEQ